MSYECVGILVNNLKILCVRVAVRVFTKNPWEIFAKSVERPIAPLPYMVEV